MKGRKDTKASEQGQKVASSDTGTAGVSGENAKTFRAAAYELRGSQAPGGGIAEDPFGILAWSKIKGCLITDPHFERLRLLSNSTSEHEVWDDPESGRVFKRTWPGFFGQIPCVGRGCIDRRPATAFEYLERHALQNEVFDGTLKFEGVHVSSKPSMIIGEPAGQPSFVISQEFVNGVKGRTAAELEIREFMRGFGFEPAPKSYFGWYRPADGIVVVDAKPDNFVLTSEGIVPIDLQIAQFTSDQWRKAELPTKDP